MSVFFFNDTATTEIYTLSLHDALPISAAEAASRSEPNAANASSSRYCDRSRRSEPETVRIARTCAEPPTRDTEMPTRSEEHTSELQSRQYLVCRLLLEKKTTEEDRRVS